MIRENMENKEQELSKLMNTELKRKGDYFIGLCPFHEEKTPSLLVSSDGERFKCLSCNATGSVKANLK